MGRPLITPGPEQTPKLSTRHLGDRAAFTPGEYRSQRRQRPPRVHVSTQLSARQGVAGLWQDRKLKFRCRLLTVGQGWANFLAEGSHWAFKIQWRAAPILTFFFFISFFFLLLSSKSICGLEKGLLKKKIYIYNLEIISHLPKIIIPLP